MTILNGFVMVSQLTPITEDGSISNNAQDDCTAASILAGVMYLNGITAVSGEYSPDYFKDQAYSETYVGATAASQYVNVCKQFGVNLYAINGTPAQLVPIIHEQLALGRPVVGTEPDPYVPSSYGWSHVVCFFADGNGTLTALDPYIARPVTRSDQDWMSQLLFNQVWTLQKENTDVPVTISITTPTIAAYYKQIDATHWQCLQNGVILHDAILNWYCTNGTVPYCGLSSMGLAITNEIPIEKIGADAGYPFAHLAGHGIVVVFGERQNVIYDTLHLVDSPPGAGAVYPTHLFNNGPGSDPAIWSLGKQVTDLQAQLAQDTAQITALRQQVSQQGQPDPLIAEVKTDLTVLLGKLG